MPLPRRVGKGGLPFKAQIAGCRSRGGGGGEVAHLLKSEKTNLEEKTGDPPFGPQTGRCRSKGGSGGENATHLLEPRPSEAPQNGEEEGGKAAHLLYLS